MISITIQMSIVPKYNNIWMCVEKHTWLFGIYSWTNNLFLFTQFTHTNYIYIGEKWEPKKPQKTLEIFNIRGEKGTERNGMDRLSVHKHRRIFWLNRWVLYCKCKVLGKESLKRREVIKSQKEFANIETYSSQKRNWNNVKN